jgi:NTP pyrophosphatase (non-canonical NTP hydrolase)
MGKITKSNYANASVNMWQQHFKDIYGKKNKDLSSEELWFRVFENSSKVAENLRRYKYAAAFESLAHVTCWLLGFSTRIEKNVEDVVWKKYPYICPYCRKEKEDVVRPCSCGTMRTQLEEAESAKKEKMVREEMMKYYAERFKDKKPKKLDDWVTMYEQLYGNITYSIPIEHIGFHLMEEIGEVSRCLRRRKEFEKRVGRGLEDGTDLQMARAQFDKDLDSEIADVFSWTCTLVHKIRSLAKALEDFQDHMSEMMQIKVTLRSREYKFELPEITFSDVLYMIYGKGCPSCQNKVCVEDCFLNECKFVAKNGECAYEWDGKDRCDYGKPKVQSADCARK